jgi:Protein of unknown function (DUF4239)
MAAVEFSKPTPRGNLDIEGKTRSKEDCRIVPVEIERRRASVALLADSVAIVPPTLRPGLVSAMTMYWIYEIPNWLLGLSTVAVFNVVAVGGLLLTRPLARSILEGSGRHNDIVSFFFAGIGVFYGLAMGLIAVATWENFTSIDGAVGKEAASLTALFRDLDSYAPPNRARLENALREYTRFVIAKDWPAHRQGLTNEEGTLLLDRFENDVMSFEPATEREKMNHAEVLHSLNEVVEARRLRLQSVTTGLPASIWTVVLIGALLNFMLTYLFWVENRLLHVLLVSLLATAIALLVFLTAAMDNPYRGEFSVSADVFQTVLDAVMRTESPH